ncbi:MAG: hypothetical protein K0R65_1776 [Crocinitomicaceae bacterium]|jgi:uncharacterized protein (TIGR03067 family)|nr:hypothetical protein [Crocinitomicaceae bacterium]
MKRLHIFWLPILLVFVSCIGIKRTGLLTHEIDGVWVPVKQEIGGTALPESVFKSQKLTLDGSSYTMQAESTDKGEVKYDGSKMDIYGKEGVNKGKHFTAVYKYENDQLTICYNLAGDTYPENFDTQGKPLFFLSVFERETKK